MKMTGKKVDASINTYLTGINLKEAFMKAEQALTLTQITTNNHVAIEDMKKEFNEKNKQLQDLVTNVVTENVKLKEQIDALNLRFDDLSKGMGLDREEVKELIGWMLEEKKKA